ncbi:MAG: carboxypeptidase M32 [Verrucomicrobiota bacterium]|jgi:carboxypeptidase Taq
MTTLPAGYQKLLKRMREVSLLNTISCALEWDQDTYMPPGALAYRADQLAWLGGRSHRLFTAGPVDDLLSQCEQQGFEPDSPEGANVREWRRHFDRAKKLPPSFVIKFERTKALAYEAWREARAQSKFKLFKPHLAKMVGLVRQKADYLGYEASPYDALLEAYEPGARAERISQLFSELRPAIVALLGQVRERQAATSDLGLHGTYPIAAQQAFNRRVAEAIGFDFKSGRIDTTTHPFCTTLGAGDCRLTTRYHENDFTDSLYSILHEAGHGLYEQGLAPEHFGTPAGAAASMGIHESQSRLWENHVGRSRSFWEHWHPIACEYFPDLKNLTAEQLYAAVNRVRLSFIRVEADQVTYDLHIMLRFDLELKLVGRQLEVADVPAYWNEQFEQMSGLKVTKDADGCLQDVHWSFGGIGYFPTYTLGNLNAAQLMQTARRENPALDEDLRQGRYQTLLAWLRQKVHQEGSRYRPQDLMEKVTGERTSFRHHLEYLRGKFAS